MKYILTDIEGTTTSIDFVHKVLFPFSSLKMNAFIEKNLNNPEVISQLKLIYEEINETHENRHSNYKFNDNDELKKKLDIKTIVSHVDIIEATLQKWITQDRKHPSLKKIQGMIWKEGYEQGFIKSHLYEDVVPAVNSWINKGIKWGIYSSGSVQAQKLLFAHTSYGDLTSLISNYFDTEVGGKREISSYLNILREIKEPPTEVLFLSDIVQELDAAKEAGIRTLQVARDSEIVTGAHQQISNFSEIVI